MRMMLNTTMVIEEYWIRGPCDGRGGANDDRGKKEEDG